MNTTKRFQNHFVLKFSSLNTTKKLKSLDLKLIEIFFYKFLSNQENCIFTSIHMQLKMARLDNTRSHMYKI